jgi:hypothetical protein
MTDPQKILDFFAGHSIRREMALFAEAGRPIHAWRAYLWIRRAGLPVPPWFLEYLDECAERFDQMDPKSPNQVAEAFAMDRVGRNGSIASNQLAAVEHFAALKSARPDASNEKLFAEVADQIDQSTSYVRDAYYKWSPQN